MTKALARRKKSDSKGVQREHIRVMRTRQGLRPVRVNKGVDRRRVAEPVRVKKVDERPVYVRPRPVSLPVIKVKPVKKEKEQKRRSLSLGDIFNDEQMVIITFMLNHNMWDPLLDYFKEDAKPTLDKKGLNPEYLWYVLRFRFEELSGSVTLPKTGPVNLMSLLNEIKALDKKSRKNLKDLEKSLKEAGLL